MENREKEKIRELIRLFTSENYDPELLRTFQDWIGNSVNEDTKDKALFESWNRAESAGSRAHAERVLRKVKKRAGIPVERTSITRTVLFRVAAVVAAALVIVPALWLLRDNGTAEVAGTVVTGEQITGPAVEEPNEKNMLLADGSQVWVQDRSLVRVEGQRENTLVGDALYNVKREYVRGRRFTVHTEYVSATVLGTVFRVTAIPGSGETVITLYEGNLDVAMPSGALEIGSGTRFTYTHDTGEYRIEEINGLWPEQIGERIVQYRSEVIGSVFKELERLYGVRVDYGNYSWSSEKVTMKFSAVTNLENVMYMLSGISGNFTYRITDDRVYIYDK